MLSIRESNPPTAASVVLIDTGLIGTVHVAQNSPAPALNRTTRTALADLAALRAQPPTPVPLSIVTSGGVLLPDAVQSAPAASSTMSREPSRPALFNDLQPMMSKWAGEETGRVWGSKVTYLDETERARYKVTIQNGLVLDAGGAPFDTRMATLAFRGRYGNEVLAGRAIYVMDRVGDIFISNSREQGHFHHSSFVSGAPVAAAGDIHIERGIVKTISRSSGHYEPTPDHLSRFAERLRSQGVDAGFRIDENLS